MSYQWSLFFKQRWCLFFISLTFFFYIYDDKMIKETLNLPFSGRTHKVWTFVRNWTHMSSWKGQPVYPGRCSPGWCALTFERSWLEEHLPQASTSTSDEEHNLWGSFRKIPPTFGKSAGPKVVDVHDVSVRLQRDAPSGSLELHAAVADQHIHAAVTLHHLRHHLLHAGHVTEIQDHQLWSKRLQRGRRDVVMRATLLHHRHTPAVQRGLDSQYDKQAQTSGGWRQLCACLRPGEHAHPGYPKIHPNILDSWLYYGSIVRRAPIMCVRFFIWATSNLKNLKTDQQTRVKSLGGVEKMTEHFNNKEVLFCRWSRWSKV